MRHGATADHRMFNAQVDPLLQAGYRVVVMDERGHGQSRPMAKTPTIDDYADDFLAVLDDRTIDDAVYLGQCWAPTWLNTPSTAALSAAEPWSLSGR